MNRFKSFVKRRGKLLSAAAFLLVLVLVFAAVTNPALVGVSSSKRSLPVYCVARDDKCVSLTFDAAWGNEDTEELIAILEKYNVKATFFIVGQWVDKYPESVKALSDAGMEVMNHSDDHAHFASLSPTEIAANVSACNDKVEAVTGVRPNLFRCPYGEYDDEVVDTLAAMDMYTIQWDVDSLDWKDLSASDITRRVLAGVSPGSIVLFHNAAKNTPAALPAIIESLLAEGYAIVPVGELLLPGEFTVDHQGRMHPAA